VSGDADAADAADAAVCAAPTTLVERRLRVRTEEMADAVVALEDIAACLRRRKPALLEEIDRRTPGGDEHAALRLHASALLDADYKAVTLQRETLETRLGAFVGLLERPWHCWSSERDVVMEACVAERLCLVPMAEDTLRFFGPAHVARVPAGEP
jgi:hypothetical protein